MTLTDVRRNILESGNPDWYNNVEESFNFQYVGDVIPLKGVSTIFDFVQKQVDGWNKLGDNIPAELIQSRRYFENVKNQIENFITAYNKADLNQLQNQWGQIHSWINNTNQFPLKFNSPEVGFLLQVYQNHPGSYPSAYNYTLGINYFNLGDKNSITGLLLAYEFSFKDVSQIVKRGKAEKSSFRELKNELEGSFSKSESYLMEHLKLINDKYNEIVNEIDNLKKVKEESFDNWFTNTNSAYNDFSENSKNNIKTLENTYEELLRLKKPADYWKARASILKNEGWSALRYLVGLIVLACLLLYFLLWQTPEGMLKSFFQNDASAALRWSIIFITLISFLAFGIRSLTKLTFSSFHLARDAEEREQLTYVYLALIKEANLEKEERQLVMQSLFSRADTGLLKDDSSPTMPGANSLLEKVVR